MKFSDLFWAASGLALLLCLTSCVAYSFGYRTGQIDALNGVVKYELRKQPDGSTAWVEKQQVEKEGGK